MTQIETSIANSALWRNRWSQSVQESTQSRPSVEWWCHRSLLESLRSRSPQTRRSLEELSRCMCTVSVSCARLSIFGKASNFLLLTSREPCLSHRSVHDSCRNGSSTPDRRCSCPTRLNRRPSPLTWRMRLRSKCSLGSRTSWDNRQIRSLGLQRTRFISAATLSIANRVN